MFTQCQLYVKHCGVSRLERDKTKFLPTRSLQSGGEDRASSVMYTVIEVSITRKGILHCINQERIGCGQITRPEIEGAEHTVQTSQALSDDSLYLFHLLMLSFKHMTSEVAVEGEEGLEG